MSSMISIWFTDCLARIYLSCDLLSIAFVTSPVIRSCVATGYRVFLLLYTPLIYTNVVNDSHKRGHKFSNWIVLVVVALPLNGCYKSRGDNPPKHNWTKTREVNVKHKWQEESIITKTTKYGPNDPHSSSLRIAVSRLCSKRFGRRTNQTTLLWW